MKNCTKKFLFFKWLQHDFEGVDIKEDVKIIGKKFREFEVGIYIRQFITTFTDKCKSCGEIRSRVEQKEETVRQYQ